MKNHTESFIPLHDNVLVKKIKRETSPIKAVRGSDPELELSFGKVITLGEYGKLTETGATIPTTIEEGQTIVFNEMRGQEILINDEEFIILKNDWILGILQ